MEHAVFVSDVERCGDDILHVQLGIIDEVLEVIGHHAAQTGIG